MRFYRGIDIGIGHTKKAGADSVVAHINKSVAILSEMQYGRVLQLRGFDLVDRTHLNP